MPLVPSYKKRLEPERNGLNQNEKRVRQLLYPLFFHGKPLEVSLGKMAHGGKHPVEENIPRRKIEKRAFSKEERI